MLVGGIWSFSGRKLRSCVAVWDCASLLRGACAVVGVLSFGRCAWPCCSLVEAACGLSNLLLPFLLPLGFFLLCRVCLRESSESLEALELETWLLRRLFALRGAFLHPLFRSVCSPSMSTTSCLLRPLSCCLWPQADSLVFCRIFRTAETWCLGCFSWLLRSGLCCLALPCTCLLFFPESLFC